MPVVKPQGIKQQKIIMKGRDSGITLLELVMVVVVIGILASTALPLFEKTKEHAYGKEAIANLRLIAAAERIYRMEYGYYYPKTETATAADDINTALRLSLNMQRWAYSVGPSTTTAFTSTATRTGGSGVGADCAYSIAQNSTNDEPTPVVAANCP